MDMALTRWQVIVKKIAVRYTYSYIQYRQIAYSSCFGRSAVLGISSRSFVSTDSWPAYKVISYIQGQATSNSRYWRPMTLHVHYMPYMQDER